MVAKQSIIPVFVPHLGCSRNCVFCNQREITGTLVQPTAETVRDSIVAGLEKNDHTTNIQLALYGGSFTAIPTQKQLELLGAALPFLRDGRLSSLRLSTRPDAVDRQSLARLRAHGVKTIELGAQSMCNEVLEASGRGHTAEQTEAAARLIKEEGFELVLQMMTGLPRDTKLRSVESAKRLIELEPDGVRIYPTVVLENTELYHMWKAGEYKEHTVEQAVDWCTELLYYFGKADVQVIRLGLNPSEELSSGAVVAGAYHPAFGELVYSRIMLYKARSLLLRRPYGDAVVLGVNKSEISTMIGQKHCNIETLRGEFGLRSLRVQAAELKRGTVILL